MTNFTTITISDSALKKLIEYKAKLNPIGKISFTDEINYIMAKIEIYDKLEQEGKLNDTRDKSNNQ